MTTNARCWQCGKLFRDGDTVAIDQHGNEGCNVCSYKNGNENCFVPLIPEKQREDFGNQNGI